LMQFKSGWGAKEQTIRYYRYDLKTDKFVCHEPQVRAIHRKIFHFMPLPLSRFAGKVLYRHVG